MEYKIVITHYGINAECLPDGVTVDDEDKMLLILEEVKDKIEMAIDRYRKDLQNKVYNGDI